MRVIKSIVLAATALSMMGSTVLAQTAQSPASKLSVSSVNKNMRAGATAERPNHQFGGGFIIPVVIVVAVGLGLYFALKDDDDDPVSA